MSLRRSLLPLLVLAATACNRLDNNVQQFSYALVYSDTHQTNTGYVIDPTMNVLKSAQLSITSSVNPPDTCVAAAYSAEGGVGLGNLDFVDAGETATLAGALGSRTLAKDTVAGVVTYRIRSGGLLPVTPGDTVRLTAPGAVNGFPGFTLKATLAEAFTRDSIAVPPAGQNLALRWSASGLPAGSAMLVSLRYNSSPSNQTLNSQIYCFLKDDGAYDVPAAQLSGLRDAAHTEFVMSRWRSQLLQVDNTSVVFFSNTFTVQSSSAPTLMRTLAPLPR